MTYFARLAATIVTVCPALLIAAPVTAQAFFATEIIDPTVGVDRGSALMILPVTTPTTFLTFDTYGSTDIGRGISALGLAFPNTLIAGDQLDIVLTVGGIDDAGGSELRTGGLAYRRPFGPASDIYVAATVGEFTLGAPENAALAVAGNQIILAAGLRRFWTLGASGVVTAWQNCRPGPPTAKS